MKIWPLGPNPSNSLVLARSQLQSSHGPQSKSTSWGPHVQTQEPTGDSSRSSCNILEALSPLLVWECWEVRVSTETEQGGLVAPRHYEQVSCGPSLDSEESARTSFLGLRTGWREGVEYLFECISEWLTSSLLHLNPRGWGWGARMGAMSVAGLFTHIGISR